MGDLPDVRPSWADAIAAIKVGQQPLIDMIEYLVVERSELLAEVERLRIDVHGCGCPAPYDSCPHDEPLTRTVVRLNELLRKSYLEREKARIRTAERVDQLRDDLGRAVRERDEWEANEQEQHRSYETLAAEHEELQEFAGAMAAAVGWETEGETWLDKATNWRQDPESLPGLYAELNTLRRVARVLAALDPDHLVDTGTCVLCGEGPGDFDHDEDCPWAAAKDWSATHGPSRLADAHHAASTERSEAP